MKLILLFHNWNMVLSLCSKMCCRQIRSKNRNIEEQMNSSMFFRICKMIKPIAQSVGSSTKTFIVNYKS